MKFIRMHTETALGNMGVLVPLDSIESIMEQPDGGCLLNLLNGSFLEVVEDMESIEFALTNRDPAKAERRRSAAPGDI